MKTYHMNSQSLFNLVVYSFTPLACSLFFSYPLWCPSVWLSSLNHFLFTSVPNICSFFCNPKCFFLVGNTIVLFLIGEWKFLGSQPSPAAEIYDEYARRTRASSAFQEEKAMELEKDLLQENLDKVEEEKEEKEEKEEQEEKNGDEDGEEDEPGLPDEELNRRAEEFIARINKQRWLEARLLVYDGNNNTEDTHALLTD